MPDVQGKTIVVTGASAGTGAAAARALHRRGAIVVPVGRSTAKTEMIAAELGGRPFTVDFASLADVKRLAVELLQEFPRIDVLAANAGAVVGRGQTTVDGLEPNFQINALGPWLLMRLLAPRLAGGRIVSTSSHTHVRATLDVRALDDTRRLSAHQVYARAKLAGGLLLREFGRRNPSIVVADFHPGIIASDLGRYMGRLGAVLKVAARPFIDSPEDGARRLINLVTTDEAINGQYFFDERHAPGSPLLNDHELASELWDLAERLTIKFQ